MGLIRARQELQGSTRVKSKRENNIHKVNALVSNKSFIKRSKISSSPLESFSPLLGIVWQHWSRVPAADATWHLQTSTLHSKVSGGWGEGVQTYKSIFPSPTKVHLYMWLSWFNADNAGSVSNFKMKPSTNTKRSAVCLIKVRPPKFVWMSKSFRRRER